MNLFMLCYSLALSTNFRLMTWNLKRKHISEVFPLLSSETSDVVVQPYNSVPCFGSWDDLQRCLGIPGYETLVRIPWDVSWPRINIDCIQKSHGWSLYYIHISTWLYIYVIMDDYGWFPYLFSLFSSPQISKHCKKITDFNSFQGWPCWRYWRWRGATAGLPWPSLTVRSPRKTMFRVFRMIETWNLFKTDKEYDEVLLTRPNPCSKTNAIHDLVRVALVSKRAVYFAKIQKIHAEQVGAECGLRGGLGQHRVESHRHGSLEVKQSHVTRHCQNCASHEWHESEEYIESLSMIIELTWLKIN